MLLRNKLHTIKPGTWYVGNFVTFYTKLTNIHAFNISWFLKFKAIGVLFPLDYGDAQAQSARHLGKLHQKQNSRCMSSPMYRRRNISSVISPFSNESDIRKTLKFARF